MSLSGKDSLSLQQQQQLPTTFRYLAWSDDNYNNGNNVGIAGAGSAAGSFPMMNPLSSPSSSSLSPPPPSPSPGRHQEVDPNTLTLEEIQLFRQFLRERRPTTTPTPPAPSLVEPSGSFQHSLQSVTTTQQPSFDSVQFKPHDPITEEKIATAANAIANTDVSLLQELPSLESDYSEFPGTTHAWAIFAGRRDVPGRATRIDRLVGCFIIFFQLFTYGLFTKESTEDYQRGQVVVRIRHDECRSIHEQIYNDNGNIYMACDAGHTNSLDALVAYTMLGIFLTGDFLQAGRAIRDAPTWSGWCFACLAGLEVVAAFLSASIAVSYQLYIGEVADAVQAGVGLLFIRELSNRAYDGIRQKAAGAHAHMDANDDGNTNNENKQSSTYMRKHKRKQYTIFFTILLVLVAVGFIVDPLCQYLFAT